MSITRRHFELSIVSIKFHKILFFQNQFHLDSQEHYQNQLHQQYLVCLVKEFQTQLEEYLKVKHVIPCANGTCKVN